MFNITLAIAGDAVVQKLLFKPLGFEDQGPFESLGREVRDRYGWGNRNVTQQDGLFVSPTSIVGVELKTGSASSAEQILNYVLLMCCEEHISGPKGNTGLLFIVPEKSLQTLWRKCGVPSDGRIDASFLDTVHRKKRDSCLNAVNDVGEEAFRSLLDRLKLAAISWSELYQAMVDISDSLDPEDQGDQTLINLLEGLGSQIANHEGTGVKLRIAVV